MLSQVALLGFAFFLAASTAGSWSMLVLTSATVALFLQQSGWLCHDILVQIFKSTKFVTLNCELFLGTEFSEFFFSTTKYSKTAAWDTLGVLFGVMLLRGSR